MKKAPLLKSKEPKTSRRPWSPDRVTVPLGEDQVRVEDETPKINGRTVAIDGDRVHRFSSVSAIYSRKLGGSRIVFRSREVLTVIRRLASLARALDKRKDSAVVEFDCAARYHDDRATAAPRSAPDLVLPDRSLRKAVEVLRTIADSGIFPQVARDTAQAIEVHLAGGKVGE